MNKVKSVTHNDERQLVSQFGLLQEVLHTLRVVTVGLAAYSLHLTNGQKRFIFVFIVPKAILQIFFAYFLYSSPKQISLIGIMHDCIADSTNVPVLNELLTSLICPVLHAACMYLKCTSDS